MLRYDRQVRYFDNTLTGVEINCGILIIFDKTVAGVEIHSGILIINLPQEYDEMENANVQCFSPQHCDKSVT